MALRVWRPSGPTRGPLVAVHGIGGHSGQYRTLAEALLPAGWAVWAPDLPGHGLSPGRRGWVRAWGQLGATVAATLARARAENPTPPVLLGHSLGGAVCLELLLRQPELASGLSGLVLTNPALNAAGVAPWRVLVARLLGQLWPSFSLSTGIDMATASRDPAVVERLRHDPLRHSRCSTRLGAGFLAAAATASERVAELSLPLLMQQSGADTVTAPAAAERFFRAAGSADKTWLLYPQSRHELFDDLDRQQALADLVNWLQAHAGDGR
ncbi:MAG: alpha/beta hydrolase [Synechococcaceae cyanobacterium]|nr:alpha/beta hydrolase [Synechococcaceae cyanobacterium]